MIKKKKKGCMREKNINKQYKSILVNNKFT